MLRLQRKQYLQRKYISDPGGYLSAAGAAASTAPTGTGEATGEQQLRHDTDQGNRLKVVVVTMPPQAITGRRSERSVIQRPQD